MRLEDYFHDNARRYPNRHALCFRDASVTYGELLPEIAKRRQAIARAGLTGEGRAIGIWSAKTAGAYAGLLAVLGSGNIYVPLDIRQPLNRLAAIAETVNLAAILPEPDCQELGQNLVLACEAKPILLRLDNNAIPTARWERSLPTEPAGDEAIAYILFTSGSTGVPKGIPISHASASTCIDAVAELFPMTADDRVAQMSNLAFDVSIAEIFLCWSAAACLCIPAESDHAFPTSFIDRSQPTIWSSVPTVVANLAALGAVRPGRFPSIRLSMFVGEVLPTGLAWAWQAATPNGFVVNLYGPTETTIFCTSHVLAECDKGESTVPIGTPFAGTECLIAPVDVEGGSRAEEFGELLLAGPQVFQGYLANEASTAAAFRHFGSDTTQLWYRSGDLVRRRSDDTMVFCGRLDREIKLRGSRVDLQEIEMVLREVLPADVVAVVPVEAEDGRFEDIIAFTSSTHNDYHAARAKLAKHLPSYMIPSQIMYLSEFPSTPAGKIDYMSLTNRVNAVGEREM